MSPDTSLEEALAKAAEGTEAALAKFYELLLHSEVIVPVKLKVTSAMPLVGELSPEDSNLIHTEFEGRQIIPIFTKEEYIRVWAGEELKSESKKFSDLLWVVGKESWLHLNPCQELGKDFSPWEISFLRQGPEAIPELLSELRETASSELEIVPGRYAFPGLSKKFLSIVDAYEQIEEAFLVGVRREEEGNLEAVMGLAFSEISAEKRSSVTEELSDAAASILEPGVAFTLFDDLAEAGSPNRGLFEQDTPFYMRKEWDKPTSDAEDGSREVTDKD